MKRFRGWFGESGRDRGDRRDDQALAQMAALRERREATKADYPNLFEDAAGLFFEIDPARINYEDNADEYEPEVGTVLPRLEGAESEDDARRILTQEFTSWFGPLDFDTHRIEQLAAESWPLWTRWKASSATSPDSMSADSAEE